MQKEVKQMALDFMLEEKEVLIDNKIVSIKRMGIGLLFQDYL